MAKIISIANQKGGVGKTTTSINLGASLSHEGKSVLVIDLDPQANATLGLGINKENVIFSSYDIFVNNINPSDAIIETTVDNMDLLPSSIELARVELLSSFDLGECPLYDLIKGLKDKYDYILLDCPPSLGTLTKNALCSSDSVLIPVQCEYFALDGLTQFITTLDGVRKNNKMRNKKIQIEGILLTMLDNRSAFGFEIVSEVKEFFKEKVFKTIIPRNTQLQIAPFHGIPVTQFAPNSTSSKLYRQLAQEVVANER